MINDKLLSSYVYKCNIKMSGTKDVQTETKWPYRNEVQMLSYDNNILKYVISKPVQHF